MRTSAPAKHGGNPWEAWQPLGSLVATDLETEQVEAASPRDTKERSRYQGV